MDLGTRIKSLRSYNKITQKQLADMIGVSDATVNRYEKNLREPSFKMLKKIATALGVSASIFIETEEDMKNKDNPNSSRLPVLDNNDFLLKQDILKYLINYWNLPNDVAHSLCNEIMDYIKFKINSYKNKN